MICFSISYLILAGMERCYNSEVEESSELKAESIPAKLKGFSAQSVILFVQRDSNSSKCWSLFRSMVIPSGTCAQPLPSELQGTLHHLPTDSKVYLELNQVSGQFKESTPTSSIHLAASSPLSSQPFCVHYVLLSNSSYDGFLQQHKIISTQIINLSGYCCSQDLDVLVDGGILNPVS